VIHGVTPGKPGLLRLARGVADADIVPAVALHDALHGAKADPWVSLSCTSGKGHRFSASELHQVVQTVMWGQYEIPDRGEGPPYRVHLQVEGRRALFGMQVPLRRMREREYRPGPSGVGLDATLAYCMAYLGRVEKRDVCLDPVCGDGTSLVEAGLAFQPRVLLGGDADISRLASGTALAAASGQPLRLAAFHADALPVAEASVDKVLCDLRGKTPVAEHAQAVLSRYLTAFARALRPRRTAVVLVDDSRGMDRALSGCAESMTQLQRVPVHLSGRKAWICVLKRNG
jgi:tRNA G10  N-methylase Trm11